MKNPNRKKVTFKLETPIVYEVKGEQGISEINEIEIWEPQAGQIKKLGVIEDLDYQQMMTLAADCSDVTEAMLDLMDFTDLQRLCEVMANFLSSGPKSLVETPTPPKPNS